VIQFSLIEIGWWVVCSISLTEILQSLPWQAWFARTLSCFSDLLSLILDEPRTETDYCRLRKLALRLLLQNLKGILLLASFLASWTGFEFLGTILGFSSLWSGTGIGILGVTGLLYFGICFWSGRYRNSQGSLKEGYHYSEITQSFYELALEHSSIVRFTFEFDRKKVLKLGPHPMSEQPVWVCGLARSGTTILTDLLYNTGQFAALTYRDMPFVLAPNTWRSINRLNRKTEPELQERAHGDGLLVGIDSPEALEEVFWHLHDPIAYKDSAKLSSYTPPTETIKYLKDYISCILYNEKSESRRYLSKNNNHLMRLPTLIKAFPNGRFLIPFRNPIAHSQSLLRQHLRWVERHRSDSFSRRYMSWLCHYEFGEDHRPFSFRETNSWNQIAVTKSSDPTQFNYWLNCWIEAYRWIQQFDLHRVMLIDYDLLSHQPHEVLSKVCKYLDLEISTAELNRLSQRLRPTHCNSEQKSISPNLLSEATNIHQMLLQKTQ